MGMEQLQLVSLGMSNMSRPVGGTVAFSWRPRPAPNDIYFVILVLESIIGGSLPLECMPSSLTCPLSSVGVSTRCPNYYYYYCYC